MATEPGHGVRGSSLYTISAIELSHFFAHGDHTFSHMAITLFRTWRSRFFVRFFETWRHIHREAPEQHSAAVFTTVLRAM